MKEDEVALELQEVEKDMAGLQVDDDVSSDEGDGDGTPESCISVPARWYAFGGLLVVICGDLEFSGVITWW